MCQLETEGTQYACGHYVITKKLRKIDCGKPNCTFSVAHKTPCYHCTCDKFLGPDASETITAVKREYCSSCAPYFGRGKR